jgi:uncharacterized membrane protein
MSLLLFILSAYGLTQILCYGKIFNSWRPTTGKLGELFSCSMCMGFWVGIFLGMLDPFTKLFSLSTNLVDIFLLGLISSGTSYLLDKMVSDEGIQIQKRW